MAMPAHAYRIAPAAPAAAIAAYVRAVLYSSRGVPYRVVDAEPYSCAAEMAARVRAERELLIWSGGSAGLAWTPAVNHAARAVHDWLDHLDALRGSLVVPFDLRGEAAACRRACARWPALAPLLRAEILGQAACYALDGAFPPQRAAWMEEETCDPCRGY